LVLALLGVANHDNVGGLFRNAAGFGASCILLDPATCDPLYRKAIRVSSGATLFLPFARTEDPARVLREHGYTPYALSPRGASDVTETRFGAKTAMLFGSEEPGLPAEILAACATLRITMSPGFDSLNVATASGIALHAWATRRG
jgi:tRNA G18 (ribose-2'-O)-methylase SpoU